MHGFTLVGVVNADLQLFMPDFRASERTFQLLTQVAGRAGRSGDLPGEVIIQSYHQYAPALISVLNSDYYGFYENELNNRMEANYPPKTRFVRIEFRCKEEGTVERVANDFASLLPKTNAAVAVLGPTVPLIAKLRKYYRRVIIIKNERRLDRSGRLLKLVLKNAVGRYNTEFRTKSVLITIDIDSYSGL